MAATIIPFRKRQEPSKAVDPTNLDSLLSDLFARLDRMHRKHYPVSYPRLLGETVAVQRPLPSKGELVERVRQRAQSKRDRRKPR